MEELLGRLLGPYQLIERLHAAGPYAAYRAVDTRLFNRPVTVTIFPVPPSDPEFRGRFERAAEALSELRHPHILPLQDFGEQQGLAYAVAPFLDGPTLASFVGRAPALDEALRPIAALCDALDHAHRLGLVHGSISPEMVLLVNVPPGEEALHDAWPFLTDFGYLNIVDPDLQRRPEAAFAALEPYQPPERGLAIDRGRADLYALAAVLVALLTGGPPSGAEALTAVLPPAIGSVLLRALSPDPQERFGSGAEFVVALQQAGGADQQGDDSAAPGLLEEARAAVTAGKFRAAGRAYTAYLRLRPDDELARRELAAIESRVIRPRRPAPATSTAPATPAPTPASAAPDEPALGEVDPAAPVATAPAAPRRRGLFGGILGRRVARPSPAPAPTPPVQTAAMVNNAPPSRLPSTYRPPTPAPFKPVVSPARLRQRTVLPVLLGAVALILLIALGGSALARRNRDRLAPAQVTLVAPAGSPVPGGVIPVATPIATVPPTVAPGQPTATRGVIGNVPATIPGAPTAAPVVPTPAPTLPPLPPVSVDEFGDPNSGFSRNPGGQEQPGYWNGEYIIVVSEPDGFTISELAGRTFGDLVAEVDLRAAGAPAGGSYGLAFHRVVGEDGIDQYFVLINPETGVVRLVHWSGQAHTELLPPTPQPAVARGNATNHLVVTCKGGRVTVQINGIQIVQVDWVGPQQGVLALRADAGTGPFEAHFDNLVIRPAR